MALAAFVADPDADAENRPHQGEEAGRRSGSKPKPRVRARKRLTPPPPTPATASWVDWFKISVCSFFAGWFLVANIGLGTSVVTFLSLSLIVRVDTNRAIVTAIIAGGWTSWFPFLVNVLLVGKFPVMRLLMVLPGSYVGAFVAPWLSTKLGRNNVLLFYACLLMLTAVTMGWFAVIKLMRNVDAHKENRDDWHDDDGWDTINWGPIMQNMGITPQQDAPTIYPIPAPTPSPVAMVPPAPMTDPDEG